MKISYNWLKEYIDVNLEPVETARLLTDTGLEVEGIETVESVKGGLAGIVVGEVVEKYQHPNADRLSVTKVDIGAGELLQIVCGAPNVDKGQKVPVATIGTTLYSGEESFKIKKGKIRGEVSEGMICAEDELGLGKGRDGIMVLDTNAPAGQKGSDYFQLESDTIFEIGLTPNRSDAMSHIGVARDLYAGMKQNGMVTSFNIPTLKDAKTSEKLNIEIEIKDLNACPRYAGLTIKNIKVQDSPDWIQKKLIAIGITPINNIVDITNYVLHETGQPLHAFDSKAIKGNKVVVQQLADKTTFTTLDEFERQLSSEDLMICNGNNEAMCLAGVFGGLDSGVSEKTTEIFLESAYFHPVSVRKTAKRHGLNTDASFRFERGVDPNNVLYAIKRAAELIQEICQGSTVSKITEIYPTAINEKELFLNFEKADRLIGQKIERKIIASILTDLEIKILIQDEAGMKISIPTYRVDVTREEDVIEEILRIYGYNNIAIPEQLRSSISYINKPDVEGLQNLVSDLLSNNGYNECINNSLTKSSFSEMMDELNQKEQVILLNPLSQDLDSMRQSMLFSGLENIAYNKNRKSNDLKMYEFGKTYAIKEDGKYEEKRKFILLATGRKNGESWNTKSEDKDFFWMKEQVEHVLNRLGLTNYKGSNSSLSYLVDGYNLKSKKNSIVEFGYVQKKLLNAFNIKSDVLYAEFDWDFIIKSCVKPKTSYKEISKFPIVKRDLALLIDENIAFSTLKSIAKQTESKLLKNVHLFDVYQGEKLPKGKKSYALSFLIEDEEKTLTDKQIDKVMNNLILAFKEKANAEVRM